MEMPRAPLVAAILIVTSAVAWGARLTFGESPWTASASALLAGDLLVLTAVAVIATLLSPARWARNMIGALGAVWAGLAVILSVDPMWIVAVFTSAGGVALVWVGASDEWFRSQIKPDRVPVRASVLALALLALPAVVASTGFDDVTPVGWILAALAFACGWAYARAYTPALWIARLVVPIVGLIAIFGLEVMAGAALLATVTAVTALAWTADARLAIQPLLARKADAVSILPEMVPSDVMDSAGLDRKGRPKGVR